MTINDVVWITPSPPGAKLDRRQRKLAAMLFPGTVLVGSSPAVGRYVQATSSSTSRGASKSRKSRRSVRFLTTQSRRGASALKLGTGSTGSCSPRDKRFGSSAERQVIVGIEDRPIGCCRGSRSTRRVTAASSVTRGLRPPARNPRSKRLASSHRRSNASAPYFRLMPTRAQTLGSPARTRRGTLPQKLKRRQEVRTRAHHQEHLHLRSRPQWLARRQYGHDQARRPLARGTVRAPLAHCRWRPAGAPDRRRTHAR